MTDEQILELASEKFGIHYDRLDARFTDFARALESRVLAGRKQEAVAWMVLASNTQKPCEVTLHKSETEALRQDCVIPLFTHPAPDAAPQSQVDSKSADPTDPGYDTDTLREHVRHLERRIRELASKSAESDKQEAAPRLLVGVCPPELRAENIAAHSAEQDRIDAERWRWLCSLGNNKEACDAEADAAIAKTGASK